jgi:ferredoxin-NADP reductase
MWRKGYIERVKWLTGRAVELRLELRGGMPEARPGQFVVLEVNVKGASQRASFSLSGIKEDHWRLGVKEVRKGGVSEWLCGLDERTSIRVAGPFGDFALNTAFTRHTFVAGGSGISPIYCMVQQLVQEGVRPMLYYGNSSADGVMFASELRRLAEAGQLDIHEYTGKSLLNGLRREDFEGAAAYVCGPGAMNRAVVDRLRAFGIPDESIRLESYGGSASDSNSGRVIWKGAFGQKQTVQVEPNQSVLQALQSRGVQLDAACLVGACRTCEARVLDGRVRCNGQVQSEGDCVTTCTTTAMEGEQAELGPATRLNRSQWYVAAVIIGAVFFGLWNVPPGLGMSSKGSMNTGHSNLKCESCHKEAPGSLRQQLAHNARTAVALHDHDWVAVGYAEVDNAACQSCHERPNDRHPVSRFEELRFAAQREAIGVHNCVSCHGEHTGARVGIIEMDYCQHCHSAIEVVDDPIDVPHADLAEAGQWSTCLTCHDFHGNHVYEVPTHMANRLRESEVRDYFEGGLDPYGNEKRYSAKNED